MREIWTDDQLTPVQLLGKLILLRKLIFYCRCHRSRYRNNSVAPEPGGSSPHSQQPATGPYPEPGESTPHPPPQPISLRSILIPSFHLRLGLLSCLFLLAFTPNPCTLPYVLHAPPPFILLDWMCLMIFGYVYVLWSSPLCNILHCPVTSSLLGPNILLSTLFSNKLQSMLFP
jgi:hypothetical protein